MKSLIFSFIVCLGCVNEVTVAQEPTLTLMPSGTIVKKLDRNLYVSCSADVEDTALITEMRWSGPNGQEIPNSDGSIITLDNPASPGTLDIYLPRFKEKDVGTYVCTAVYAGNKELSAELTVESYMDIDFGDTPLHQTLIEGEDSKIVCTVTANPKPMVDWLKDMKPIKSDYHRIIMQDGVLIKQISQDDEGVYRCRAKVPLTGSIEYKDIKVQVLPKPKIESYLNITMNVGDNAEMRCVATGDPLPELVFMKETNKAAFNNGINEDDRIEIMQEVDDHQRAVGVLKISDLRRSDDGLYTCTANSDGVETQIWGHITVQSSPYFDEQTQNEFWTRDQNPVNISCIANSIPNATVQWYLRNKEIELTDENFKIISIGPIGVLQVNPVDNSYFGVYTCQANNLLGTSDWDIELKQAQVPGAISNAKVWHLSATTITWHITDLMNDGGRPIEGYLVEYRHSHDTWEEAQSQFLTKVIGSEYTMEGLEPNSDYIFRFSAKNEVGYGVFGGEQLQMMPKRAPPQEPLIFDLNEGIYESPYSNHYTVQWNIPLDNGEPIDNFQIIHYQMKNISGKLERTEDLKTTNEVSHPGGTSFKLENLMPNTIYKIELRAHNVIGYSQFAEGLIKTAHVCGRSSLSGRPKRFCPTSNSWGERKCIDDHQLCDGSSDCPNQEDEDPMHCFFFKAMSSSYNDLQDEMFTILNELKKVASDVKRIL